MDGARQGGETMRGLIMALALAWMALMPAPGLAQLDGPAQLDVATSLAALKHDLAAGEAHAAALRAHAPDQSDGNPSAAAAGIADGGLDWSRAALRLVARRIDRRLERLRTSPEVMAHTERAQTMLLMRTAQSKLVSTIEAIPGADHVSRAAEQDRQQTLDALDEALADLAAATAVMASYDWETG